MTKWLNERYISRAEHQEIVTYYKRLVGQLYGSIRDLRAKVDALPLTSADEDGKPPEDWTKIHPHGAPQTESCGGNVIHLEFRRRPPAPSTP